MFLKRLGKRKTLGTPWERKEDVLISVTGIQKPNTGSNYHDKYYRKPKIRSEICLSRDGEYKETTRRHIPEDSIISSDN
jgi:hypothetical protein